MDERILGPASAPARDDHGDDEYGEGKDQGGSARAGIPLAETGPEE